MNQPVNPYPDEMVSQLTPAPGASGYPPAHIQHFEVPAGAPGFLIEIPAADGAILVRMTEKDGCLVVTGDESRWDEGAKRFLHQMMQWSGLVGIRWKDEVKKAAE